MRKPKDRRGRKTTNTGTWILGVLSKITRRCRRKKRERVERKRPAGTTEFREEESEA